MELYLQPSSWSCLPTAFGMLLDMTPSEMFEAIGHDGSEIVWPELKDPHKRRAFHIQECVLVALNELMFPVEIAVECYSVPHDHEVEPYRVPTVGSVFKAQLELISGVLLGRDKNNRAHAVAWNRQEQMIYDPTGYKCGIEEFKPEVFYGLY